MRPVKFVVAVFVGRELDYTFGPFDTEDAAAQACARDGIELGGEIQADDRRRGFIWPFRPRP